MELKGKYIGLTITGSFYTFAKIEREALKLKETGAILYPTISGNVQTMDSRFGDTGEFTSRITYITGNDPTLCIEGAEPIGPKVYLDILLITPCTGSTLAKLVNGIMDTLVFMAAKAHLRDTKPLVISALASDVPRINFKNIGELSNSKSIYFVPFGQDDPVKKPSSMIARTRLVENTLKEALEDRQVQPAIQG